MEAIKTSSIQFFSKHTEYNFMTSTNPLSETSSFQIKGDWEIDEHSPNSFDVTLVQYFFEGMSPDVAEITIVNLIFCRDRLQPLSYTLHFAKETKC